MLQDKTKELLKRGKNHGWDIITPIEQKEVIADLKNNGDDNEDYFRIAFWLPEKIKDAKKRRKK